MPIERRTIVYEGPGGPFEGVFAWESESNERRPGVLLIPNFCGQTEEDNDHAAEMAELGYAVFACDLFGQGKRTDRSMPDVGKYMTELNNDRMLLQSRLIASFAALTAQPEVDGELLAAVGYCFGGKCALDAARAGLPNVKGVVSLHGVYDRPVYDNVTPIAAKVLVCHGWDDPIGPPETLTALATELTEGGADWQLIAYGHAGHAFTDRELKDKPTQKGMGYDEKADRRSWWAMEDFLAEVFG